MHLDSRLTLEKTYFHKKEVTGSQAQNIEILEILERYQFKMLRMIVNDLWFVLNNIFARDLQIKSVETDSTRLSINSNCFYLCVFVRFKSLLVILVIYTLRPHNLLIDTKIAFNFRKRWVHTKSPTIITAEPQVTKQKNMS